MPIRTPLALPDHAVGAVLRVQRIPAAAALS